MADFVQTMKDWRRMCQHMEKIGGDRSCDICPLGGCNAIYEDDGNTDYADIGKRVAAWAAEHPKPVYPTWYEYLFNVTRGENKWPVDDHKFCQWLDTTCIPADIAQKLGIEPKEGI